MKKTMLSFILLAILISSFIISPDCHAQDCDTAEYLYGVWNFSHITPSGSTYTDTIDLYRFDDGSCLYGYCLCGTSGNATAIGKSGEVRVIAIEGVVYHLYSFSYINDSTVSGTIYLVNMGSPTYTYPFTGTKIVDYDTTSTTTSITSTTSSSSTMPSSTISTVSGTTTSSISNSNTSTAPGVTTSTTTSQRPYDLYYISGHVTGDISTGVSIKLTGDNSYTLRTDSEGYYQISNLVGNLFYTITPEHEGYEFAPQSFVVQSLTNDLVEIDFVSTRIQTTPCPSEVIYGEDSEEVEVLRHVRDNVLNKTTEGQQIIKLYYLWSPVIVRAMQADEDFKEDIREMVDGMLPLLGE